MLQNFEHALGAIAHHEIKSISFDQTLANIFEFYLEIVAILPGRVLHDLFKELEHIACGLVWSKGLAFKLSERDFLHTDVNQIIDFFILCTLGS